MKKSRLLCAVFASAFTLFCRTTNAALVGRAPDESGVFRAAYDTVMRNIDQNGHLRAVVIHL